MATVLNDLPQVIVQRLAPRSRSGNIRPYWGSFSQPEYQPVSPARLPDGQRRLSGAAKMVPAVHQRTFLANGLGNFRRSGGNKHLDL
jgi:hypothetical protein